MKHRRFWICKICGKSRRRYKSRSEQPHCCGIDMCKARNNERANYKRNNWMQKQIRVQNKITKFKERQFTKLRNQSGEILRFSPETKQAWRKFDKTKTKPAFQKYGQLFIDSLYKDIRNIRSENSWNRNINRDGVIQKHKGGFNIHPILIFVKDTTYKQDGKLYGTFGTYSRSLLEGLKHIEISSDVKDIVKMKHTFLHEINHWIGDLADMDNGHDCYFYRRLELLEKKFKVKEINII
jgi:hypothetical protein